MLVFAVGSLSLLSFEEFIRLHTPDNDNQAPVSFAEFALDEDAFPSGLLTLY